MSTTSYSITDSNGEYISAAISCIDIVHARQRAQEIADRRAQPVWLSERGEEGAGEEIVPSGDGYSAEADDAEPSTCSDSEGALDVDVTLTTPSGETITAGCTLWPHADGRPGYGTCGTPLDGWMGADLASAVRKMHKTACEAAVAAILDAAASACKAYRA